MSDMGDPDRKASEAALELLLDEHRRLEREPAEFGAAGFERIAKACRNIIAVKTGFPSLVVRFRDTGGLPALLSLLRAAASFTSRLSVPEGRAAADASLMLLLSLMQLEPTPTKPVCTSAALVAAEAVQLLGSTALAASAATLETFVSLKPDGPFVEELLSHQIDKGLLQMLRSNLSSPALARASLAALSSVIRAAPKLSRLSEEECAGDVVAHMLRTYLPEEAVALQCCSLLAELSTERSSRARMAAAGCAPLLFEAVRAHVANADVAVAGLRALENMAAADASLRVSLADGACRGAETIVAVLQRHLDDAAVVQQACSTLGAMCQSTRGIVAAAAAGAPPVLCAVLERHHEDAVTLAAVLEKLAGGERNALSSTPLRPEFVAAFAVLGPAVVRTVRRHNSDARVVATGLAAITRIGLLVGSVETIVEAGGSKVIVASMRRFAADEAVQSGACQAVSALCKDSNANKSVFLAARAGELVLAALRRFSDHEFLVYFSVIALLTLIHGADSVRALLDDGLGDEIYKVLLALVQEQAAGGDLSDVRYSTVESALSMLGTIAAISPSARNLLGSALWVGLLQRVMQHFGRRPRVVYSIANIAFCAAEQPQAAKRIRSSGLPRAMLCMLSYCCDDASVADVVAGAVHVLFDDDACETADVSVFVYAGPNQAHVKTLVTALQAHTGVLGVTSSIARAISALARQHHNAHALEACDAVGAVAAALTAHGSSGDAPFYEACLHALVRIVSTEKPAATTGRLHFSLPVGLGGVVAEVLSSHGAAWGVANAGMMLVSSRLLDAEFRTSFCKAGGVRALMKLSKGQSVTWGEHVQRAVHTMAEDVILRLIALPGTSRYIIQASFGVTILLGLRSHTFVTGDVAAWSKQVTLLRHLTHEDDESCSTLARMGVGADMVDVLPPVAGAAPRKSAASLRTPATATLALEVLRNISACREARSSLMPCFADAAAANALKAFHPPARASKCKLAEWNRMCVAGCGLLRNLVSTENIFAIWVAGAYDVARLTLRSPSCTLEAAAAACGLLFGLACQPGCREDMLQADAAAIALTTMRKHPADRFIGWAVSGLLLKLAHWCAEQAAKSCGFEAAGGAGSSSDSSARWLPLLQEGVGAALSMHGAADARVACAAVAAAQVLARTSAALSLAPCVPEPLLAAVRATWVAHEPLAAAAGGAETGSNRSADVVARCRALLEGVAASETS